MHPQITAVGKLLVVAIELFASSLLAEVCFRGSSAFAGDAPGLPYHCLGSLVVARPEVLEFWKVYEIPSVSLAEANSAPSGGCVSRSRVYGLVQPSDRFPRFCFHSNQPNRKKLKHTPDQRPRNQHHNESVPGAQCLIYSRIMYTHIYSAPH